MSPGEALRFETLNGGQIAGRIEPLAKVRIEVFRDWPYLYEGSLDYERHYLDTYARSPGSLAVLVWEAERCIGATTSQPLAEATDAAQRPFLAQGMDLERIHYFGESVLLPGYRGRGLGVKFFEAREAHARRLGQRLCAFCSVDRPDDHPARPAEFVPNDAFWTRRGYRREPSLRTEFSWTDVGSALPSPKPMTFWTRELMP